MAGTKQVRKPARKGAATLTSEERAALRETVRERKLAASGANDERAVLARIAAMPPADRALAQRVHAIVRSAAPGLTPKTWYGMPAYANKDGKAVVFFQDAAKFKARYATLGFNDTANLDDGEMWPTSYALRKLTASEEAKIAALVKRAVR